MKRFFNDRYMVIGVFVLLFVFIIVIRLFELQIVKGAGYRADSERRVLREMEMPAPRGDIEDRYGVTIAANRQGFSVQIIKTALKSNQLNEMLFKLSNIFKKNNDKPVQSLNRYLTVQPFTFGKITVNQAISWQTDRNLLNISAVNAKDDPRDAFNYLRESVFDIDEAYTVQQAYGIMQLRYEILSNGWAFTTGKAVLLAMDVSSRTIAEIEERRSEFKGIVTDLVPVRIYKDSAIISHILGYVRGINEEQLKKLSGLGYTQNDIIGQTGIESSAEKYLKGINGTKCIEVDTKGSIVNEVSQNPGQPGFLVQLTLDMELQKTLVQSLERTIADIRSRKDGRKNFGDAKAGAAVVIDVNSGEILAMASHPNYDPALYLEGPDNKTAQQKIAEMIMDNSNKPLLNRAIQEIYAPGSTFKPLTAIAGLEEKLISPDTVIFDPGTVNIGGKIFRCLEYPKYGHGELKLEKAMATSCNIYFHKLGYMLGVDKLEKWAMLLGLGQKTGIDISGERSGILASKEFKKRVFNDIWRPADTAQVAIGQLYNAFTPLQIANYVSTIANGGKKYVPHLIKKVVKYDGSIVMENKPEYEKLSLNPLTMTAIKKGMVAVTNAEDGTAKGKFQKLQQHGISIAGKTGTPETGFEKYNKSSNGLFICYAPADNPKVAVAVVIEHGVWGANAAPVARDVLEKYFGIDGQDEVRDKTEADRMMFLQ